MELTYNGGVAAMGDEVTRVEHEALCSRVGTLERTIAVTENEISHIREDISSIRKGITWLLGTTGVVIVGAILKLILKV